MGFEDETILPQWLLNVETQAVIIAGLCCVGAWVIFQWIIQIMFTVLWPFFLVAGVLLMMPTWRKTLATEILPHHVQILKNWTNRFAFGFNTTTPLVH